jgi:hypothetical protein
MKRPPRSVRNLLRSPPRALASVIRKAAFLQEIEQIVHDGLPPEARQGVKVAACEDDRLVLLVDNAGWATRLRYQQNAIRRGLAQRLRRHVERVDIRVRPVDKPPPPPGAPRRLSENARRQLEGAARCVENPRLAAALRRLATSGG